MTEWKPIYSSTPPTKRCYIGCLEPGCTAQIPYTEEDITVPFYCAEHRTSEGRHAETRMVRRAEPPKPPDAPEPMVEMMCPSRVCHSRVTITQAQYLETLEIPLLCKVCGKKMLYHKEVEKE